MKTAPGGGPCCGCGASTHPEIDVALREALEAAQRNLTAAKAGDRGSRATER